MDNIYAPIKQKKISEEITDQLKSLISQGKLKPGEKLPAERELAKSLNVSRVSLREALNKLQGMGLLEIQQGNRTFVRPITTRSIFDPLVSFTKNSSAHVLQVFEIRKYLEIGSVSLAAERATNDEIKQIERNLKLMEDDLKKNRLGAKADLDFHSKIVEAAHNHAYLHIMHTLYDLLQEELRVTWGGVFGKKVIREKLFKQHKNIFSAIKQRNPQKGAEETLKHLSFVEENWKNSLG
jgi:GntR family transcriptional repressor for pyruvate dehydrogenase complex